MQLASGIAPQFIAPRREESNGTKVVESGVYAQKMQKMCTNLLSHLRRRATLDRAGPFLGSF
jgi:hypothetical protein